MAQSNRFYSIHGDNGLLFKINLLDAGYVDKALGFPIHQIKNLELVEAYKNYYLAKQFYKLGKLDFKNYMKVRNFYKNQLNQFHIKRV